MGHVGNLTIDLPIFLKMGTVHCYLLKSEAGYVLVGCGGSNGRKALDAALVKAAIRKPLISPL